MNIQLRIMKEDDASVVTQLCSQLGYEIDVDQVQINIKLLAEKKNSEAFVTVHENKIVGWISVAYIVTIESLPHCEIRGLVIDEAYRKNNIGKMLIEKVKQWCAEKNCDRLRVRCNVKRKDTHAFYTHLGFSEKKEQKVFEINV